MFRAQLSGRLVTMMLGGIALSTRTPGFCDQHTSRDQFTYYEGKGFPLRFIPNVPAVPKPMPFQTLGAGKLDRLPSCTVGLAVGPSALDRAKYWLEIEKRKQSIHDYLLSDNLLKRENLITPFYISNPAKVGVVLRFSSSTHVEHLLDVLKRHLPSHGQDPLLQRIRASLGTDRTVLLKGEEISFYWFDNDMLMILHNGDIFDAVRIPYLSKALLEAFVGHPEQCISQELYHAICDRLPHADRLPRYMDSGL